MRFDEYKLFAALVSLSVSGFLYAYAGIANANAKTLTDDELASTAAQMVKKLPRSVINAPKAKRFSVADAVERDAALARATDEITVVGERDPEDLSVAKRPPMLAFRDRLEKDRPSTPYEKTQFVLCIIGLCGAGYGPDGAPVENLAYTRAEKKKNVSSLQLSKQFTGTLQ